MEISIPEGIRTLESYDLVAMKNGQAYIRISLFEYECLDFPLTLLSCILGLADYLWLTE